MSKPSFEDKSWDDYSFWQSFYYCTWDSKYRNTLQNEITTQFETAESDLGKLGTIDQKNPLAALMKEWRKSLGSYARAITCDEGEKVKTELTKLAEAIHSQWIADELLLKSGKKKLKQKKVVIEKPLPTVTTIPTPKAPPKKVMGDDSLDLLVNSSFGKNGHSVQTAKTPPKKTKAAPYKPPTKQEIWGYQLAEMEEDCSDTIIFGEHDAAGAVLYALNIHGQQGTQERPRKCENTNNETRIIFVGGRTFWTVGLSHSDKRKANTYLAYERTGKKQFTYVSGKRHPKEP